MQNYTLIVAYDGTDYAGWQVQKDEKTISSVMQKIFFKIFNQTCTLTAASRTDAGVHAEGQVVMCKTNVVLDPAKLKHAWNNGLPPDILIRSIEKNNNNFHPFFNVSFKIYKYTIFTCRPLPKIVPFGWYYRYPINRDLLQESLEIFVGEHDFEKFCTKEPSCAKAPADKLGVSTIRAINNIKVNYYNETIDIIIEGKSFIRHMIRRIVGAAVLVASNKKYNRQDILELLENKDETLKRDYCFEVAPACGLTLLEIKYKNNEIL